LRGRAAQSPPQATMQSAEMMEERRNDPRRL
jgi:hypothetical protein